MDRLSNNGGPPLQKKPRLEFFPVPPTQVEDATRRCEVCEKNLPRSKYGKKQWKKAYGGWQCRACVLSEAQRSHRLSRETQVVAAQADKRNRHEQKLSDQAAKQQQEIVEGRPTTVFSRERRCVGCQLVKPRSAFSGKQWKQLFRECAECVQARQQQTQNQATVASNRGNNHDQEKTCSGCDKSKKSTEFSTKQWNHGHDADRWCKRCWTDEELAREDHRRVIAEYQQDGQEQPSKKRCFACHKFKDMTVTNFSGKQRKKVYGVCVPCVAIIQDDRRRKYSNSGVEEKVCSVCQTSKGCDDFAREQWKGNSRTDRKCRVCAAAHVKEQEEHRDAEREYQNQYQVPDRCISNLLTRPSDANKTSSETLATRPPNNDRMRRCFQCKKFQPVTGYTGRQVTKTYPTCRTCTATDGTAPVTIETKAPDTDPQ